MDQQRFQQLLDHEIKTMCDYALMEDLGGQGNTDITAELVAEDHIADAVLITREDGVLCGKAWVEEIFRSLGGVEIEWMHDDGNKISANDTICKLTGNARALLTGERSAMNFLQSLSATASLTASYADAISSTNCQLLDTRKTIPGMRYGQKYAVRCGGGTNHRIGLSDAFLIKENHIIACGGIASALSQAQQNHPDKLLEIEVESLYELEQALDGGAQVIMLDNFSLSMMQQAVATKNAHNNSAKLEASGNVDLETIGSIAETGVDYISVGALTKNIRALDLSMRIKL